jgi:acyl carrier protein
MREVHEVPDDRVLARLTDLAAARFGPRAAALPHDADLFEVLGIDSLQALDLLTDLEEAFAIEIPDYELQGANTLAALAAVIRSRR